jgi:hypothetical protein
MEWRGGVTWTGLIWIRRGTSGELFGILWWTFPFHEVRRNFWLSETLLPYQEGRCSMKPDMECQDKEPDISEILSNFTVNTSVRISDCCSLRLAISQASFKRALWPSVGICKDFKPSGQWTVWRLLEVRKCFEQRCFQLRHGGTDQSGTRRPLQATLNLLKLC